MEKAAALGRLPHASAHEDVVRVAEVAVLDGPGVPARSWRTSGIRHAQEDDQSRDHAARLGPGVGLELAAMVSHVERLSERA
jgi:hypothetical protein